MNDLKNLYTTEKLSYINEIIAGIMKKPSAALIYFSVATFGLILISHTIIIFTRKEIQKENKTNLITMSILKFLSFFIYFFVWFNIIIYAWKITEFKNLKESITLSISEFSFESVLKHALFFKGIIIRCFFAMVTSGWFYIITALIGAMYILVSILSTEEGKDSKASWFLKKYFFSSWVPVIQKAKAKFNEFTAAFKSINSNLPILLGIFICISLVLTLQIVSVAHIIGKSELSKLYIFPLLLLIDWAFNCAVIFSKFFVYLVVDRKNDDELKEMKITCFDVLKNLPILCFYSLQLTLLSTIHLFDKFFKIFGFFSSSWLNLIEKYSNSFKMFFSIVFQIQSLLCDESIAGLVIKQNYEKKTKERSTISSDALVETIFKERDIFLICISSFKNVILRYSLHFAVASSLLLGQSNDFSYAMAAESTSIFALIFKNITPGAVIFLIAYFIFSYYIMGIESAYIINKTKKYKQLENNDIKNTQ